jgi:hypothetical protein
MGSTHSQGTGTRRTRTRTSRSPQPDEQDALLAELRDIPQNGKTRSRSRSPSRRPPSRRTSTPKSRSPSRITPTPTSRSPSRRTPTSRSPSRRSRRTYPSRTAPNYEEFISQAVEETNNEIARMPPSPPIQTDLKDNNHSQYRSATLYHLLPYEEEDNYHDYEVEVDVIERIVNFINGMRVDGEDRILPGDIIDNIKRENDLVDNCCLFLGRLKDDDTPSFIIPKTHLYNEVETIFDVIMDKTYEELLSPVNYIHIYKELAEPIQYFINYYDGKLFNLKTPNIIELFNESIFMVDDAPPLK